MPGAPKNHVPVSEAKRISRTYQKPITIIICVDADHVYTSAHGDFLAGVPAGLQEGQ